VGRRRYRRVEIDVTGFDVERVRARVAAEADPDTVLDVVLVGTVAPQALIDPRELEEALQDGCFRARVRNQAAMWLDDTALQAFPERTLVGRYIRLMRDQTAAAPAEERPLLEEAVQVGVAMLLGQEGA